MTTKNLTFDYTNDVAADHSAVDVAAAFKAAAHRAYLALNREITAVRDQGAVLNDVARSGVAAAFYADQAETPRSFDADSLTGSVSAFGKDFLNLSAPQVSRLRHYDRVLTIWSDAGFPTKGITEYAVRSIPNTASDADILAVRERIATDHDDRVTGATVKAAATEMGVREPDAGSGEGEGEGEQTTTDDEAIFLAAYNLIVTNPDRLTKSMRENLLSLLTK